MFKSSGGSGSSYYSTNGSKADPLIKIYLKEAGSIPMLSEGESLQAFVTIEENMINIKRALAWFKIGIEDVFSLYDRVDNDETILDELSHFGEDGSRVRTLDDGEWRDSFMKSVAELRKLVDQKEILDCEIVKMSVGSAERSTLLVRKRELQRDIGCIVKKVKLHPLQVLNLMHKAIEEGKGAEQEARKTHSVGRLIRCLRLSEERIKLIKQNITKSNLRLVVNIAKKYIECEVPLMDLIQEGNMGLMRAVNRFDYAKGFHFSTYASWWIKQAVTRAIADQGKTVRIPVHMVEILKKYRKANDKLLQEYGRRPDTHELANDLGVSEERMAEVQSYSQKVISLYMPILDGEKNIEDTLEDPSAKSPIEFVEEVKLQESMDKVLKETLDVREEKILRMRFGLGDYTEHTLSEIGKKLGVCRERVRQLEKRSLKKLGKPLHELCLIGA